MTATTMGGVSEARSSGYGRSVGGLIGSLVVALLAIAFVWGLSRFQHRDVENPTPTVDYVDELTAARDQAPFGVLAPDPVPDGWRPTSARWDGVGPEYSWHLGFLTSQSSDADYVGLEQGNAAPSEFVAAATPADQPGAPVEIRGQAWQTLTSNNGEETALVLAGDHETTVVTGSAPEGDLVAFAETLSAGDRQPSEPDRSLSSLPSPDGAITASSLARAPSSQRWQMFASSSPRSHSAIDSSRVSPPDSRRWTTVTSSSRASS
jgi:hypothetical protein